MPPSPQSPLGEFFPDPSTVSSTALFSFNPLVFFYFVLAFLLVPYPFYRLIAARFRWETNVKTSARHWSDIMHGFSYGCLLFAFGNYTKTLSWVTVGAFYPSLLGYALIAELPFTKTSLPRIKEWPLGMWIVFITAIVIILAFAAFHIYLASQFAWPFVVFYVSGLLVPLTLLLSSVVLLKEVNSNWTRSIWFRIRHGSAKTNASPDPETQALLDPASTSGTPGPAVGPANPYTTRVALHIHHWQIFYTLAFFTRFDHPVSQVAAGIVIACYMEGVCAYGYDALVNDA